MFSPIDGSEIARVHETPIESMPGLIAKAKEAFNRWREVPAPRRGELVRLWGEELRRAKADIGFIISLEVGKIREEGLGEVQEASTSAILPSGSRASCSARRSSRSVQGTGSRSNITR